MSEIIISLRPKDRKLHVKGNCFISLTGPFCVEGIFDPTPGCGETFKLFSEALKCIKSEEKPEEFHIRDTKTGLTYKLMKKTKSKKKVWGWEGEIYFSPRKS